MISVCLTWLVWVWVGRNEFGMRRAGRILCIFVYASWTGAGQLGIVIVCLMKGGEAVSIDR